tara:strand:- start:2927 stop:3364 length:438 start_codon:yes stop_codon:yes gene_type:complete
MRIDVDELATFIFKKNTEHKELYLNIRSLKTTKELFFFLFDIFCKGIILLFGENNKMKLNSLEPYQFEIIKEKMKYAHILLTMTTYDESTAKLLDLIPENVKEKNVIQDSINDITKMEENEPLTEYVFKLFMNETLFCINFDIIR